MLIGVLGFGSIWSSRVTSGFRHAAYFNTTGVNAAGRYRHRSCVYGYVRIDECTGFRLAAADRAIDRTYESDPLSVWQGRRKLFLKGFDKGGNTPDVYLVRLAPAEVGWIDRGTPWLCSSGVTFRQACARRCDGVGVGFRLPRGASGHPPEPTETEPPERGMQGRSR